ncbi:MAG: hypothetical protein ACRETM_13925 [Stenotrophobium sp.]
MKSILDLPALHFVGHSGKIARLAKIADRAMFIPDANLVLCLLQKGSDFTALPEAYRSYLLATRVRVRRYWHEREEWIPVNPTYAAMELGSQDVRPDRVQFDRYFTQFLSHLYQINNVDPRWIDDCFTNAQGLISSFLPSLIRIFSKALELMPAESGTTDVQVERAVMAMCDWLEAEVDHLAVIGGLPLYVIIYAFAGSPEARRILKPHRARKLGAPAVARNIAWDFIYYVHREFSYLYRQYNDDIFCTADIALADLLAAKIHHGPRYERPLLEQLDSIDSFGEFLSFHLSRLNGTRLSKRLEERVVLLLARASVSRDTVAIGFTKSGLLPVSQTPEFRHLEN